MNESLISEIKVKKMKFFLFIEQSDSQLDSQLRRIKHIPETMSRSLTTETFGNFVTTQSGEHFTVVFIKLVGIYFVGLMQIMASFGNNILRASDFRSSMFIYAKWPNPIGDLITFIGPVINLNEEVVSVCSKTNQRIFIHT